MTAAELPGLVDEHYGAMHRLARLVGDPAAAPEVVRAAWLKASGEPRLTRVRLLGLVLGELAAPPPAERVPAAPAHELEADDSRWPGWWQDDLPATPDPADEGLEAALASLAPGLTALLVLRDVERLDASDVEALLGHSVEQQLVLLQQARSALRSALRGGAAA